MNVGDLINEGRLQILSSLGEGGMGLVFKAQDHQLNKVVVVKTLRPELAKDPERLAGLKREVARAHELNHPNIITIYDLGYEHRVPYIKMEFLDGTTLDKHLQNLPQGRVGSSDFWQLARQVLAAIHHAHAKGIIHRDLKPDNIFVLRDGTVKVTDLGIAARVNDDTEDRVLWASPHYVSPEQIRGEKPSAGMDIYSIGCLFYQMLCGHPPFTGEPDVVLEQQRNATPVPLQHVSAALGGVVMRCLAKSPDDRYRTITELRVALERAVEVSGRAVYGRQRQNKLRAVIRSLRLRRRFQGDVPPRAAPTVARATSDARTVRFELGPSASPGPGASVMRNEPVALDAARRYRRKLLIAAGVLAAVGGLILAIPSGQAGRVGAGGAAAAGRPRPTPSNPRDQGQTGLTETALREINGALTEGDFHHGNGDYEKAIAAFEGGLKVDPQNEVLKSRIARSKNAMEAERRIRGGR